MKKIRIHLIVATRPNFVKAAPLLIQLDKQDWCVVKLIHTGQHYDQNMSKSFFLELNIREPNYFLAEIGVSHAEQTSNVMLGYEKICKEDFPDWTIVIGDVNSTLACSITAKKMNINLAHLESGLRSFDKTMPEEINRIITDSISDLHWAPSMDACENLLREGVDKKKISFVGNIMIDSLKMKLPLIKKLKVYLEYKLVKRKYGVVTLHRPSNVDDLDKLKSIFETLNKISISIPLIIPLHPRTERNLKKIKNLVFLNNKNLILIKSLSYLKFMNLILNSKFVVTDSGGIQEETTYLKIKCFTLRNNTERPITILEGTNELVSVQNIEEKITIYNKLKNVTNIRPKFWDGNSSIRIVKNLYKKIKEKQAK